MFFNGNYKSPTRILQVLYLQDLDVFVCSFISTAIQMANLLGAQNKRSAAKYQAKRSEINIKKISGSLLK